MEIEYEELNDELTKAIQGYCNVKRGDRMLNGPEFKEGGILHQVVFPEVCSPPTHRMKLTGDVMVNGSLPCLQEILDFEVRKDDIWLLGLPKCGTTMTQEMIWVIKHDFNIEEAKKTHLLLRFPTFVSTPFLDYSKSINVNELKSPRMLKCHFHRPHLPKQLWVQKPKTMYICRNPKDAAISAFHFYRLFYNYSGPLELFLNAFIQDKVFHNPYWGHVKTFWQLRDEPNFLFLHYEDIVKDMRRAIKMIADFLVVNYTKEQEDRLVDHMDINNFRENKSINIDSTLFSLNKNENFIREGKVKGWKQKMTPEMVKMFDDWIDKNLEGSDFPRTHL